MDLTSGIRPVQYKVQSMWCLNSKQKMHVNRVEYMGWTPGAESISLNVNYVQELEIRNA